MLGFARRARLFLYGSPIPTRGVLPAHRLVRRPRGDRHRTGGARSEFARATQRKRAAIFSVAERKQDSHCGPARFPGTPGAPSRSGRTRRTRGSRSLEQELAPERPAEMELELALAWAPGELPSPFSLFSGKHPVQQWQRRLLRRISNISLSSPLCWDRFWFVQQNSYPPPGA